MVGPQRPVKIGDDELAALLSDDENEAIADAKDCGND